MATVSGETGVKQYQGVDGTAVAGALLTWWSTHSREVTWRAETEPWIILVAEVMSQQTQLRRVNLRLPEFIARFPTPEVLASAGRTEILAAWSGLGYNRRALWLQQAARQIHENGWPEDAIGLQALPGVGPYTAAAVASLAWGESVPAVDTNHRRVMSRWFGKPLDGAELEDVARSMMPIDQPAEWNQAVMDLANAVCRPEPRCEMCPVSSWCNDPTVYIPPAAQSRYEGSARQARGAILKSLVHAPRSLDSLLEETALPVERLSAAIESLVDDGTVACHQDRWQIID